MARYKHVTTGVVVEVADDLVLGAEWGSTEVASSRSEAPDSTWKVADLKAYAADNGIDLGDATKKDDVLAVITAGSDTGGSE